jgi:hypothetical protein
VEKNRGRWNCRCRARVEEEARRILWAIFAPAFRRDGRWTTGRESLQNNSERTRSAVQPALSVPLLHSFTHPIHPSIHGGTTAPCSFYFTFQLTYDLQSPPNASRSSLLPFTTHSSSETVSPFRCSTCLHGLATFPPFSFSRPPSISQAYM